VPGLGFLLNNEMDDFTTKPGEADLFGLVQGEANAISPGKRPVSSMAPTILLRDGELFMTVGAPRIHHQWLPDRISAERGISPDTVALLKARGHDVDYNPGVVLAQVAAIVNDGGWLQGASDGRTAAGKASGY
jgi:gamma-glutamyltranspeptidase/glutathione hydrolase